MKVLVTGASGFIGSALIKQLSNVADVELTGISRNTPTVSAKSLNINWLQGDLADKNFVEFLSKKEFDKVFHLAWQGLPDRSADYCQLNLKISKDFLAAITKMRKVELNVLGSCLEYGNITGVVQDHTSPIGNDDFSKAKIELHSFVRSLGSKYRWYRPFYVYGNGQNPRALMPTILKSIESRMEVEIRSLNNSHDFIAVEDVANAIYTSSSVEEVEGEINIGTGVLTCVGEIVQALHSEYKMSFDQTYSSNPGLYADSIVLRRDISWSPSYSGLAGILDYYRRTKNQ